MDENNKNHNDRNIIGRFAVGLFAVGTVASILASTTGCSGDVEPAPIEEGGDQAVISARPIFEPPERPVIAAHPFILVHAFHGSATNDWSFAGVKEALEHDGHVAVLADLPLYNGTPERARLLGAQIDSTREAFCRTKHPQEPLAECLRTTKVNLVGHSQGGLDARYVVGKLGYGDRVATITTLGAPHRGTPIGDVGLRILRSPFVLDAIADTFFELYGKTRTTHDELAADTDLKAAIYWLSEERSRNPADDIPDDARVHYEAWAGYASADGEVDASKLDAECDGKVFGDASHAPRFLSKKSRHFLPLIPAFHGRLNDGHIPISSAKAPQNAGASWEFRGCIPADHLDLIGRPEGSDRVKASERTGFRHLDFYRVMAHELAKRHGA